MKDMGEGTRNKKKNEEKKERRKLKSFMPNLQRQL